ncbi:MAG: leucine-rich repeat domain-containing protein [Clostridia bacterium]|nr:leucine-rich repeat domain-containing protein [Clostridia bacterium]
MIKEFKGKVLSLIALFFVICLSFTVAMLLPNNSVKAENESGFSVLSSAKVYTYDNGDRLLKFQTEVGSDWLTENSSSIYSFGTLIFPTDNGGIDTSKTVAENETALDCINVISQNGVSLTNGFSYTAGVLFDKETITAWIIKQDPTLAEDQSALNNAYDKVFKTLYSKYFTAVSYAVTDNGVTYSNAVSTSLLETGGNIGLTYSIVNNSYAVVTGYSGRDADVVIPDEYNGYPVTQIGNSAFYNDADLVTIKFGKNVTRVGSRAFYSCDLLKRVEFNDKISFIAIFAFYDCIGLERIYIPSSITQMEEFLFEDCDRLTIYCEPTSKPNGWNSDWVGVNRVTGYEAPVIWGATIKQYECPHSFTNYVYNNNATCSKNGTKTAYCDLGCELKDTKTASGTKVDHVYTNYVSNNDSDYQKDGTKTASCDFGCGKTNTITDEGTALDYTRGLVFSLRNNTEYYVIGYNGTSTEIHIPDYYLGLPVTTVTGISLGAMDKEVTAVTIGNNVTSLQSLSLYYWYDLTTVTFSNSVKEIDMAVFSPTIRKVNYLGTIEEWAQINFKGAPTYHMANLYANGELVTEVKFTNITKISNYAFYQCGSITKVEIPSNVTSIGESAFAKCSSLCTITVDPLNPSYKAVDNVLYSKDGKEILQYVTNKTETAFIIPDGVNIIKREAFDSCKSLTSLEIPSSVTSVGASAFSGCDYLTYVNYLGTIDEWAQIEFDDHTANPTKYAGDLHINEELVTEVNLLTATKVSTYAFYNCRSIVSVYFGDNVASLDNYNSFYACLSLSSITVSDNNSVFTAIDGVLYSKDGKTLVKYLQNLPNENIFIIPNGVTTIDDYAFLWCDFISFELPSSVTSIGRGAFDHCTSLETIIFNGTIEEWQAIEKIEDWDLNMPATKVVCSDGSVEL